MAQKKTTAAKSIFFMRAVFVLLFFLLCPLDSASAPPYLSNLAASKDSPLYTTYAAAMERSEFVLDEGYHFRFYDPDQAMEFVTDTAGSWGLAFRMGTRFALRLKDMHTQPVITLSYPDMVRYSYRPFSAVKVDALFFVYSSRTAFQDIRIQNTTDKAVSLQVIPYMKNIKHPFQDIACQDKGRLIRFSHEEPSDQWVTNHHIPHISRVRDVFLLSRPWEYISRSFAEISESLETLLPPPPGSSSPLLAAYLPVRLEPGETRHFRFVRGTAPAGRDNCLLIKDTGELLRLDPDPFVRRNEELFSRIPKLHFQNPDHKMLYWSAFNLMRQVMLPAEGKCGFNYYVFSREPSWGWGHGGQVFHESLTMLAYAFMDPKSAMDSQRIYLECQHPDGYINYRTGPYLDETIPYNHQLTTSAPWYAWQNWEIYKITRDRKFLAEMYASSQAFYTYYTAHRDTDGDGLCEWGAHAVLESVRDSQVAVWDQVGWPANFEALDLNTMLVMEANSLAAMAEELGRSKDAQRWKAEAESRWAKVNKAMWDEETGFFYSVDKKDNDFTFKTPGDMKRQEIIGFLPLWAGTASKKQAEKLVQKLLDPHKFWRRYGVPSLAADDPYYNPKGYWNGPVWVEWNYLMLRGLLNYGYGDEAAELVRRVTANMAAQLKKDHQFWEFYSPDNQWAGYHRQYIWAGLAARMLMDIHPKADKE